MPPVGVPHPTTTQSNVFAGSDSRDDVGEPGALTGVIGTETSAVGVEHPPGDVGTPNP